jgi:hypothetical protein
MHHSAGCRLEWIRSSKKKTKRDGESFGSDDKQHVLAQDSARKRVFLLCYENHS